MLKDILNNKRVGEHKNKTIYMKFPTNWKWKGICINTQNIFINWNKIIMISLQFNWYLLNINLFK